MTITERKKELEDYYGKAVCPPGFDAFWEESLVVGHTSAKVESVPFQNPNAIYEKLELLTAKDTVHARVIRPRNGGPFPTIFMFHDMGRNVRGWYHMTRFSALGYAVVALEHNLIGSPKATDYSTEQLRTSYVHAILLMKEAMKLSFVDPQKVLTWGEGFGGGLAVVTAAMTGRPVRCAALNPMPADIQQARCSADDECISAWDHLDVMHFAHLVKGSVLLGTSLMDTIANVAGQYALFNRLVCEKSHLVYPNYAHERINFFENELLKFMAW